MVASAGRMRSPLKKGRRQGWAGTAASQMKRRFFHPTALALFCKFSPTTAGTPPVSPVVASAGRVNHRSGHEWRRRSRHRAPASPTTCQRRVLPQIGPVFGGQRVEARDLGLQRLDVGGQSSPIVRSITTGHIGHL